MLISCSGGGKSPPILSVDGDADSDSDGDTDSDSDADADNNPNIGLVCTPENAAQVCGGLYCVDGVCCVDQCTGTCGSCNVLGNVGHCTPESADTVCRASIGPCDVEEVCNGSSAMCPEDTFLPAGSECGDQTDNDCDNPNTCDANGVCLDNFEVAGGDCTDASGECKVNPACDGAGQCTSAENKADETPCGDDTLTGCDHPDWCMGGICRVRHVPAGTACGDPAESECDLPDTCDGEGLCAANVVEAETVCGDQTETECDQADQCDGAGLCDPRFIADETACGDSFDDDCNHPDTCLAGVCEQNLEPDDTVCNAGNTSVVYRCSEADCLATPQSQTVGWTCTTGECTEVLTPEWVDVADACTASQVCTTNETSFAECVECNEQQPNECIGKVATGYYPDGYCGLVGGVPECVYDPMEEDCLQDPDGNFNCVDGACTSYTCEAGEKDTTFTWGTGDEGWTLGNWTSLSEWPWQNSGAPYLTLAIPTSGATEEDTYLISPEMGLYACTTGTASFHITKTDQYDSCSPLSYLALECGADTEWEELWSMNEIPGTHTNPVTDKSTTLVEDVDITPCLGKTEVYFRFSVQNMCGSQSISAVFVDDFAITAVQEADTAK